METTIQESLRTEEQSRRLWWLAGRLGLDREAVAKLVEDWTERRTRSTRELTFIEARELISRMEEWSRPTRQKRETIDKDRLRKGVIKAIFAWFDLQGKEVTTEYVRGVACKAAGGKMLFNELSEGDLRRIYAEFCKKQSVVLAKKSEVATIDEENIKQKKQ